MGIISAPISVYTHICSDGFQSIPGLNGTIDDRGEYCKASSTVRSLERPFVTPFDPSSPLFGIEY